MTRLALLRHAPTAWNREGRIQGRTDIPLDAAARSALGPLRLPEPWPDARLVSSPLSRAMETARLVADRDPEPIEALREMDWGAWEGAFGADLKADPTSGFRDIEDWGHDFCPPSGEPLSAFQRRVLNWAETLDQDTLAVCHIGVMRALLARATGWRFDGPCPFRVKRNRLFIINISSANWHLSEDVPRLEGAI